MAATKVRIENLPVVLHTRPALDMDEEQFFEFCQLNREWRIERSVEGDLEIMPPIGGETGKRNFELTTDIGVWARGDSSGVGFDSSTGFVLPNGAIRDQARAAVGPHRRAEAEVCASMPGLRGRAAFAFRPFITNQSQDA